MRLNRSLDQQIAVFGEAGSGKTVMVSSFYGATQEPHYLQKSLFHVVADDIGQGAQLHRNYLGMRESARLPMPTRFSSTTYSFSIKLKDGQSTRAMKARPFDALRLVWHDYPGEWFETDVSGPEEAGRRVDAFRSLLGSDVALLLVDAQRLLDNAGDEERYLKSLLSNVRNGLLSLKQDVLADGKPLIDFPRIWLLALSKSDLLPHLNVFAFRDLLIEKAADDIDELRKVLGGFVEASDAMSVGEDFLLLSSASFDADRIEVTKRVGLELLLPLAAMLPLERHARWAQAKNMSGKVVENLMGGAGALAVSLLGKGKLPGPLGVLIGRLGPSLVDDAARLGGDKLEQINAEALAKGDHLTAILTRFRMDLDEGEAAQVLLRSPR